MSTVELDNPTATQLTPRWTPLRYHPQQSDLWRCEARFIGVPAGRRSGKTELAKRRLVQSLAARPGRYFFGGPTHEQAKRIAWDDLVDLTPRSWIREIRLSEPYIKTVFGSELWCIGLDKPARAEGVGWDGCVLDESCDLKPGVFERSIRPALADRGGWCWRIGVPKRFGPSAKEYRLFCEDCAADRYPDGKAFTWPSRDILPAEEIAHARATMDAKDFREQYEASWETVGGAVFHAFDRTRNVRECFYYPDKTLVVGSDFNVNPMAWVLGHRYKDKIEWFDELWMTDANTPRALDDLYGRYRQHKGGVEFYGDASASARKTSAARSDYAHILNHEGFKRLGRTLHYPKGNPPVADRFAACNAMLCNAYGQQRMFVDPKCRHLIDDLESRAYKLGTREPDDRDEIGHITDAMGYAVMRLFPIRVEPSTVPQTVIARSYA